MRYITLFLWIFILCLAGGAPPALAAVQAVDDAGATLALVQPARRIISLAPHTTELLYAAGAGPRVVAAVDFSDYPPAAQRLPRVGGAGRLDLEAILALRPDLVVAWGSGNPPRQVARLRELGLPVYISEPRSFGAIAANLEALGALAGTAEAGRQAARALRVEYARLRAVYGRRPPVRVFYQVWDEPLMTVSDTHFIGAVVALCGGQNVFGTLAGLTPTVDVEAVLAARPEAIVGGARSGRPAVSQPDWKRWPQLPAVAGGHVFTIDADLMARPTPRLLRGAAQLCERLEKVRLSRDPAATARLPRPPGDSGRARPQTADRKGG